MFVWIKCCYRTTVSFKTFLKKHTPPTSGQTAREMTKNPDSVQDDPEWFWVLRADGQEGFVPAGFVYPLDAIQRQREYSYNRNMFSCFNKLCTRFLQSF
jgi:hypothetical protein